MGEQKNDPVGYEYCYRKQNRTEAERVFQIADSGLKKEQKHTAESKTKQGCADYKEYEMMEKKYGKDSGEWNLKQQSGRWNQKNTEIHRNHFLCDLQGRR